MATSAPPMTASVMRPSSRAAGRAGRLRRRFRLRLLRSVRRHLRHGRARAAATAASAAPTCATTWRSASRRRSRQDRAGADADLGVLRSLLRHRRQGRHQAEGLSDLRRRRPHPPRAGLLHAGAHLSELPGPRPGDRQSVSVLLGLRPRDARAHAVGQHPARRRGRHPHPACRRRRSRRARRAGGRPLHFPLARRAPVLPARRRRPALPGADLDGGGGARRRVRGADHRRRQDPREGAGRHPVRPALPPAGQGHAGAALASRSATCTCRWWSRRRRS